MCGPVAMREVLSRLSLAAFAVAFCGACEGSSPRFAQPVYFQASDSAYVIRRVEARFGQGEFEDGYDETQILFGSILDVDKTPSGWAVVDGLNRHIVLLDSVLNPLRVVGRVGEGPGEFQAPSQLSMLGDTMGIFDMSTGRVSYLGPQGDLLRVSEPAGRYAMAFAVHSDLGEFFPILSRGHYLLRAAEDRRWLVAPIPVDFRPEIQGPAGLAGMTSNLVAITQDGIVHVLDGRHLALVSYDLDESPVRIAFLPRELRDPLLEEQRELGGTFGGRELLLVRMVNHVGILVDGRVFVSVRHGTTVGYVLDPASVTASPIVVDDNWGWLRNRNARFF